MTHAAPRVAHGGNPGQVSTNGADLGYALGRQLRAGTAGHIGFRNAFGIAFGGFKRSGQGREGGAKGLLPCLETKTMIVETALADE